MPAERNLVLPGNTAHDSTLFVVYIRRSAEVSWGSYREPAHGRIASVPATTPSVTVVLVGS